MTDKELKNECMENAEIDLCRYSNSELEQIREAMRMYAERKLKLFAIPDVSNSVCDCSTCGTFDKCDCDNCLNYDRWIPKAN